MNFGCLGLPGYIIAIAIFNPHHTSAYECFVEEGREPNWEDYSCESYWECSNFEGVLTKCTGADQFHFEARECLPNSEVWCQWQHLQASDWREKQGDNSDHPDKRKTQIVHVHHDPGSGDEVADLKVKYLEKGVSPHGITHVYKQRHDDRTTNSHPHPHEDGLTHSHTHTHEYGLTHSHPHTHEGGLTHSHHHTQEDGRTHYHPHTHEDGLTHSHPHSDEDGLTHSHPHTHEDGHTHSHPHTHEDGLTHSHAHTHKDGTFHSHPISSDSSDGHSHGHTHTDGTFHSHPHTHDSEHRHEHEPSQEHVQDFETSHPDNGKWVGPPPDSDTGPPAGSILGDSEILKTFSHIHGGSTHKHAIDSDGPFQDEASHANYRDSGTRWAPDDEELEDIDEDKDLFTHYSADQGDVSSWPYVCETEYGHEPNLQDLMCKSFWRCDDYKGSKIVCKSSHLYDYDAKACRHHSHVDCHAQMEAYTTSGSGHSTEVEQRPHGVTIVHHYYHQGDSDFHEGHHGDHDAGDYDYGSLREGPKKFKVYQHQNNLPNVQVLASPQQPASTVLTDTTPGLSDAKPSEMPSPFGTMISLLRVTRLHNTQSPEARNLAASQAETQDVLPSTTAEPPVLDNDTIVTSGVPTSVN